MQSTARHRSRTGNPPVGMAHVSPRQRPSTLPREYAARLDRLRVQDCIWARMKPAEIARQLGKDKAWVTRTIQGLETEGETAYRSPKEMELVGGNLAQLDSLLASALSIGHRQKDAKTRIAAIRVAADLLRQKSEYEIAVGFVHKREARADGDGQGMTVKMIHEEIPESAVMAILERRAVKMKKREEAAKCAIQSGAN